MRKRIIAAIIAMTMALTPAIVFADKKAAEDAGQDVLMAKASSNATAAVTVKSDTHMQRLMATAPTAHFDKTNVKLHVRETVKLNVIGGSGKTKKWKSSKKKVATVKKGVVKAKKAGKTTITVKKGKKKIKCRVTVVMNSPYLESAPDYQAVTGAKMKKHEYEDGLDLCMFKYSKAGKKKYIKKLKAWGFVRFGDDGVFINDQFDIVVVVTDKKKRFLGVAYGNAWDESYDDWDE